MCEKGKMKKCGVSCTLGRERQGVGQMGWVVILCDRLEAFSGTSALSS